MLLLLTLACQSASPSWDLLTPTRVEAPAPAPAPAPRDDKAVDPAFKEALDLAAKAEDPWGEDEQAAVAPPAPASAVEPEPVVEAAPAPPPAPPPAPSSPTGLPSQPAWGLRLLSTLPHAQPPRAVVGLPSGEEVVVSPGSMLPQVGIVVVAVGSGAVQVARVTPAGDHANIETQNLVAQY